MLRPHRRGQATWFLDERVFGTVRYLVLALDTSGCDILFCSYECEFLRAHTKFDQESVQRVFLQHAFQTDCVGTWDTMNVDGEFVSLQLLSRLGPSAVAYSDRLIVQSKAGFAVRTRINLDV